MVASGNDTDCLVMTLIVCLYNGEQLEYSLMFCYNYPGDDSPLTFTFGLHCCWYRE